MVGNTEAQGSRVKLWKSQSQLRVQGPEKRGPSSHHIVNLSQLAFSSVLTLENFPIILALCVQGYVEEKICVLITELLKITSPVPE